MHVQLLEILLKFLLLGIKIGYNIHVIKRLKLLLLNWSLEILALFRRIMRRIQLCFQIYFCSLRFNFFRFFLDWLRYFLNFLWWSHIRREILWTIPRIFLFFLIRGKFIGIFKCILLRLFSISSNYVCFRNIFVLWYQVIFLA